MSNIHLDYRTACISLIRSFTTLVSLILITIASAYSQPNLALGPFGPGIQDGAAPFDDNNCANATAKGNPGDDCGEHNLQVRSQDGVIFNWSITANNYTAGQENLKNVVYEQTLHPTNNAVINFARVPARCTPVGGGGANPSSSIVTDDDGNIILTCNLGEFSEGGQVSFSTVVKVSGESLNGETFTSTQRVYSNDDLGNENATAAVSAEVGPIEISARPRLDLISSPFRGYYVYGKRDVGNGPENGFYTYYNFRVATHNKTGTEAIAQPISFKSVLTATKEAENGVDYTNSGLEYYITQCMYNPSGWGAETWGKESYYLSRPISEKVVNSGDCQFSRDDPANNASAYTMTVNNADLSGKRFPTKTIGGSDLSAGPYYYINMRVQFFIPTRIIDNEDGNIDGKGNIYIKNTLKAFSPISVSGISNYGANNEPGYNGNPMANGSISNNVAPPYNYYITTRGSFSTSYYKDDDDTGWHYHYLNGTSWHSGNGIVGPDQAIVEKIFFQNSGSTDLTDPRSCLAFDNTTMKLTDRGEIGATTGKYAYIGEYASNGLDYQDYVVEYGHVDLTGDDPLKNGYSSQSGRYQGDWSTQSAIRCNDAITTWKTDPTAVAGGIDAVNVVRTRVVNPATIFESADYLRLNTPLKMRNTFNGGPHTGELIPSGTVLASFASVRSDQWVANWYPPSPRYYKPSPETGNSDGDRVTFSRVTSAIDSESLSPVAAPGQTASTIAGKKLIWKLNTAISSSLATPQTVNNVKIIDELPPEVSYDKDCTLGYKDAQGNTIGTPADQVEYNKDRNGNPKPGYTRLIWNLGTWTANNPITPKVICTTSDSLVANGTAVINYAEIRGDGLSGSALERSDTHTITLEQVGSIQVSKKVDSTLDDVNDDQIYTLSWANFAASFAIEPPTIIDVFSFNNDDSGNSQRNPKSEFTGLLKLIAPPSTTWLSGANDGAPLGTWYYTTDEPSTVNYDPDNNTSNWVLEAALAGDFSQVTAIKFISNYKLEKDGDPHQGMKATFTLRAGHSADPDSSHANHPGEIYTNLFTLDTPSLPANQFLKSNSVSVQIASYSVGDLVFADVNSNLKYDEGIDIPAIDGTVINLHKAVDDSIIATTTLGSAGKPGRYLFTDIGSGEYYVSIPASEFQSNGNLKGWSTQVTVAGADDDKNDLEDQDGYTTGVVVADGVRTNVFELSAIPPLAGDVPKGNEPLGDNTGQIIDPTNDDFSNLTVDIALVPALDYGDAPQSYGIAGHGVIKQPLVYLGVIPPDTEAQPQHLANGGIDGQGDDQNGLHDEDSIQLVDLLSPTAHRFQVNVATHNNSSKSAKLIAWLDFNHNGLFDSHEAVSKVIQVGEGGTIPLAWENLPAGSLQAEKLWLRVRLSTDDNLTNENAIGSLLDGEVEDYAIKINAGVGVSGSVFNDTNVVGGIKDISDLGIPDVTVVLHDFTNNKCRGVKTNKLGYYQFTGVVAGQYDLYESAVEKTGTITNCPPVEQDPGNYRSSSSNKRTITVAGNNIENQDFADVKLPIFNPSHQDTVLPGNVVFYRHKYTAYSNANLNFSTTNNSVSTDWTSLLYEDYNCNGRLDGNDSNSTVSSILIAHGGTICLINKVYAPTNVISGETFSNTITANFNTGNPNIGQLELAVTDTTTAANNNTGLHSKLKLIKKVQNMTQGSAATETQNMARPGDILKYLIYFSNTGTGPISELKINDVVPEFTTLHGLPTCQQPLPASITNCSATVNGDEIEWMFGVGDVLNGGGEGMVSYEVSVE